MNTLLNPTTTDRASAGPSMVRASTVLRRILSDNPEVTDFSIEQILSSIGDDRFEASLMMFSIPAIVPVPVPKGTVSIPSGVIACQMLAGHKQIRLPRFIRKKSISRRALAVAIHAILPILEAAEKVVRPRWGWVNHSIWRRVIGLFVLLMVVAIAFPLFGFNPFHATSIFVISLGMAEKDGLTVMVGVVAGVLSLVLLASDVSVRAVRQKVSKWLWKLSRKLGLTVFANFMNRLGHTWLAKLLSFQWSTLLMKWDPEKHAANRARAAARATSARARQAEVQRGPKAARPQRGPGVFKRLSSASAVDASLFNALA